MPQGNLGDAVLAGIPIQGPAPQAGTQTASGLALRHYTLDHAVGVLLDDVKRHAACGEEFRQHMLWKARLLLVEVDGDNVEAHRGVEFQAQQDVEEGEGVLSPGQADHDLVALRDHAVVGDGFADQAAQALFQFVEFKALLFG